MIPKPTNRALAVAAALLALSVVAHAAPKDQCKDVTGRARGACTAMFATGCVDGSGDAASCEQKVEQWMTAAPATGLPGVAEVCGDGVDNNFDGQIDEECANPCPCQDDPLWDVAVDGITVDFGECQDSRGFFSISSQGSASGPPDMRIVSSRRLRSCSVRALGETSSIRPLTLDEVAACSAEIAVLCAEYGP